MKGWEAVRWLQSVFGLLGSQSVRLILAFIFRWGWSWARAKLVYWREYPSYINTSDGPRQGHPNMSTVIRQCLVVNRTLRGPVGDYLFTMPTDYTHISAWSSRHHLFGVTGNTYGYKCQSISRVCFCNPERYLYTNLSESDPRISLREISLGQREC